MEKLFEDVFSRDFYNPLPSGGLVLDEQADCWIATIEMPGVKKEDLEVSVAKGVVSVKGKRKGSKPKTYDRRFHAGLSVDLDRIDASLIDGLLEVRIPKQKVDSPRMIEIKSK